MLNSHIQRNIYFVICVDKVDDSKQISLARSIELELIVGSCGLSRIIKEVNGKRVIQCHWKYGYSREQSLKYNKLYGQSLARAFRTQVWLHHDKDGEFLLTPNMIEERTGNLNNAIEILIGEKIEQIIEVCSYPGNDGSLAQHSRGLISSYLHDFGLNGIATLVRDEFETSSAIIDPERKIVKKQIIATID